MLSQKSSAKNVHVIPQEKGWVVKSEGAKRADKAFSRKADAISRAKSIAERNKRNVIVHRKDGKIDSWKKPHKK